MDRKALLEVIQNYNNRLKILEIFDYYEIDYDEECTSGRFRALCPFHSDHAPSLIAYTDNDSGQDSWWCPPCDETGDCFRFIQMMEKGFQEAIEVAKKIVKNSGSKGNTTGKYKEAQKRRKQEKKLLLQAHDLGVHYREWLRSMQDTKQYENACKRVDEIFKEVDDLLQERDYQKTLEFLREKRKKLRKQMGDLYDKALDQSKDPVSRPT